MEIHLLQDLAIVMTVAGAMTLLCHWLRQPVVIGYLIAGLLIGPFTPPFLLISNLNNIHTMAELGLVFLLFSLGLEFNLPKIRKVGASAGLAALLEVIGMLVIGYLLGQQFGWSKTDSIFLGAILSISSTTIIVKVFMDFKMMHEKFAQVVFGILILEDIVAVAILSILSGLGSRSGPDTTVILGSFLRIGFFVTLFLVSGLLLVPRFIHWVASFKAKEVLGIVTLGFCLGGSLIASYFQFSIALGAFLMGAVLATSKEINEIEEWIHPVRDMFSAIFFVSAGMLIQPQLLWEYKIPILILTLVTIIGKVFTGAVGSFLAGFDMKTSMRVGMSLAQIGEFSFVIATLGISLKVTSEFLYPLAVTVSSLTTLATPYLIHNSDRLVETFLQATPLSLRSKLENYQTWFAKAKSFQAQSHATAIFSKYLVRLGIYFAVLVAFVAVLKGISVVLLQKVGPPSTEAAVIAVLWSVSGILCLPLFMIISKYANHIVLLLVTKSKPLLHSMNVHTFYNTLNAITLSLLEIAFIIAASDYAMRKEALTLGLIFLLLTSYVFRRKFGAGQEWLEGVLDQIIGLATSEPTRQAVLKSGDSALFLADITDQVTLPRDSFAHHKTIREIRLREQTGATIVRFIGRESTLQTPALIRCFFPMMYWFCSAARMN